MSVSVDVAWKSLNKYQEELCGDKVEVLKPDKADVLILADGMGSGVKANILATLTSQCFGMGLPLSLRWRRSQRPCRSAKCGKWRMQRLAFFRLLTMEKRILSNLTIQAAFLSGIKRLWIIRTKNV